MGSVDVPLDQAAGLRRLVPGGPLRVITLSSTQGAGRSTICASLALALARAGRRVLVLDCAEQDGGAAALLGASPGPDLLEAARSGLDPHEVSARTAAGVTVARARRAMHALGRVSDRDRDRLGACLEALCGETDCILVDSARGDVSLAAAGGELILVLRAEARAVVDSYRLLKRLALASGRRQALVLVNHAVPGVPHLRFFGNLSDTATRFLGMSLDLLGEVPQDDCLRRASSLVQPVVEMFPASPAAGALRGCALALLAQDAAGRLDASAFVRRLGAAARLTGPD
jgi:flagellar biosynthesis protein FlhG